MQTLQQKDTGPEESFEPISFAQFLSNRGVRKLLCTIQRILITVKVRRWEPFPGGRGPGRLSNPSPFVHGLIHDSEMRDHSLIGLSESELNADDTYIWNDHTNS